MKSQKLRSLLLCCIGLCLYIACKKDNHSTPPPPAIPKIKTVSADAGGSPDIRTYTYDSKGRVTKIVYSLYGTGNYVYTDTSVVLTFYSLTDTVQYVQKYHLDANGLATSYSADVTSSDQFLYTYNSDAQLLMYSDIRTLPAQPIRRWDNIHYYTNKNLDSVVVNYTYSGNTTTRTDHYDAYFTDQKNTIGNENYGQAWLGASSKNPVKAARDLGEDQYGNQPGTVYQYQYDSLGRITKQQEFMANDNSAFTPIYFTYY